VEYTHDPPPTHVIIPETIIFVNDTSLIIFRKIVDDFCTTAILLCPHMNECCTANKQISNLGKTNITEFIRNNWKETYVAASIF
jgi:hypothetical protein